MLRSYLTTSIESFPDLRRGTNTQYSIKNIALSAFAVFFCQSPSFLAHQQLMEQMQGTNNGRTLFGIQKLPTDNQIRNLLDPVDPKLLRSAYRDTFSYLQARGEVESFRSFANTLLVAIDRTGYFHSESIHCDKCTVSQHRDGRTTYAHTALMSAVVKPGRAQVIALEPEFIVPQDGHEKQDCESAAAKRWIREFAARYSSLGITLLGDGLYATQPMIEIFVHKIFTFKNGEVGLSGYCVKWSSSPSKRPTGLLARYRVRSVRKVGITRTIPFITVDGCNGRELLYL